MRNIIKINKTDWLFFISLILFAYVYTWTKDGREIGAPFSPSLLLLIIGILFSSISFVFRTYRTARDSDYRDLVSISFLFFQGAISLSPIAILVLLLAET